MMKSIKVNGKISNIFVMQKDKGKKHKFIEWDGNSNSAPTKLLIRLEENTDISTLNNNFKIIEMNDDYFINCIITSKSKYDTLKFNKEHCGVFLLAYKQGREKELFLVNCKLESYINFDTIDDLL